jgi:Phosphopantetheine attachment site
MAVVDTVHLRLCDLIAEMMGGACGRPPLRAHLSFLQLGGTEAQAAELMQIVNTLFTLDLPADTILRSPTPDALARTIATAWFDADGNAPDLAERTRAIAEAT